MYLFVILSRDSAQGERVSPLYGYRNVQPEMLGVFETFRSEMEYPIWPFWSQTGHGFCALVLNLVCAVFLKEASFSSLAIRPGNQTIQYRSKGLQHYTRVKRVCYTHITRSVHSVSMQCPRTLHANTHKMRVITRV